LGTLFRLIFIDLQNVGVISAAPCRNYRQMTRSVRHVSIVCILMT